MLQYVAVFCIMLHYVTAVMSVDIDIQDAHVTRYPCRFVCAVVCCSVLQCVAVCCSMLQCFEVCRSSDSTLACRAPMRHDTNMNACVLQYVAVCCSMLQYVAVCCSMLQ